MCMCDKMRNQIRVYHTVGTVPKSNIKITKRDNIDTPNTQLHNRSLSWLGTGTKIKSGEAKLILWVFEYFRTSSPTLIIPNISANKF